MRKRHSIRILILEDDIEAVALLTWALMPLEEELEKTGQDISLVVLSEYSMVEDYINQDEKHAYDIVLLDRDCKSGGSFHTLSFEKFDLDNIISISSTPEWNAQAQQRGITRIVYKDFGYLRGFVDKVMQEIRDILGMPEPPSDLHKTEEPLYEEAVLAVRNIGKASATALQDELKIGYARAARLLDLLEQEGIIGPAEGNEPRKILHEND